MGLQRSFDGNGNVGPIATNTLNKLAELDIRPTGHQRMPKRVEADHFAEFDRVIAVSKDEHQPMLVSLWPESVISKVAYFDVEDLHIEGPGTALPRLITHLDRLIDSLSKA